MLIEIEYEIESDSQSDSFFKKYGKMRLMRGANI